VTFARSGKTVEWSPEAASLLGLAEGEGVALEAGCRAGNCGTCVTAVRSGEVEYSLQPGATPGRGNCLTCVAVPKSDVVLDA
jgi:ferredoxin